MILVIGYISSFLIFLFLRYQLKELKQEKKTQTENKEIMEVGTQALETLREGKRSKLERQTIEKLERMMRVSTRINLDRMQDVLDMSKKKFNNKIFEWAEEYGFTIDSNDLVVNKDTVSDFIDMLDGRFNDWQEKEKNNTGKI